MPNRPRTGPKIWDLPDHAAFVALMSKLHRNQIEYFFFRVVGNRETSIILRELAYWFDRTKKTEYPRATIFRDGYYWVARTKQELFDAHGIERKQVELAYRQTRGLVETKNMKFGSVRVTHWRFNFTHLLRLLREDRIIQESLQEDDAELSIDESSDELPPPARRQNRECSPIPLSSGIPECPTSPSRSHIGECTTLAGVTRHSHTQPSAQEYRPATSPGFAGPADAGSRGPSPSALPGAVAPEPPPAHPQSFQRKGKVHAARVLELLESFRGLTLKEKSVRVKALAPGIQSAISYLAIWQSGFEAEHPKRRCPFNDQDVDHALALSEEEISPERFYEVMNEAQDVVGPTKGRNPVFMCQNHSHEFKQLCKHFSRMEGELIRAELIDAS